MRIFISICGIIALTVIFPGKVLGETAIEEQIIRHEDFRSKVFVGPEGATLIGYGRNLKDKGLTRAEALMLLKNDIRECEADLHKIFGKLFWGIGSSRRMALIDMRYTLGPSGFREFERMIRAIKAENFALAAKEMKDSRWYRQVGIRGKILYDMILKGDNK